MKTNAIVRIILLSLAIVILSGILVTALLFDTLSFRNEPKTETNTSNTVLSNTYSIDASLVQELEIEWVSGSIVLNSDSQTNEIIITESGDLSNEHPTAIDHDGDTLCIRFSDESLKFFSIGTTESISKNLFIQVPADWNCRELSIDSASAHMNVSHLTISDVDISTASGTATFEDCTIRELDIDTASGDVFYYGSLDILDMDAVSARFSGTLQNSPQQLQVDSVSGSMQLYLPDDCGFTLFNDSLSGRFDTDFQVSKQDGSITHGSGHCKIEVNGLSGNVHINKHTSTAETTLCTDNSCTDPDHGHSVPCQDNNCTDVSHGHQTNHTTAQTHHSDSKHH